MNVIYPPNAFPDSDESPNLQVFLAGSIEMGQAIDWQQRVIDDLAETPVTILNPRRKDWDSSWSQSPDFAPFRGQVEWELLGVHTADIVFFYFHPGTMSPITLLELGLVLNREWPGKMIVCCPKDYWRYGNVQITCDMKGVPVYDSLDKAILALSNELSDYNSRV